MSRSPYFVTPLQRLMYLRTLPLFGSLPSEELAVLAEHTRERFYRRGRALLRGDQPVDAIHLLVRGEVQVRHQGHLVRTFRSRDAVGVMALLARSHEAVDAIALEDVISLELRGEVLYEIFEERFSMLFHVLQATCRLLRHERLQMPAGGYSRTAGEGMTCPTRPLDLVERTFFLRRSLPFAKSSLLGLGQMARHLREVRLDPRAPVWSIGDDATHILLLVCGRVRCRTEEGETFRFGGGDGLGMIDMLAERPRWYDACAEHPIVALELERELLLDVLEDHVDVAMDCLSRMASDVLQVFQKRARAAHGSDVPVGLPSLV